VFFFFSFFFFFFTLALTISFSFSRLRLLAGTPPSPKTARLLLQHQGEIVRAKAGRSSLVGSPARCRRCRCRRPRRRCCCGCCFVSLSTAPGIFAFSSPAGLVSLLFSTKLLLWTPCGISSVPRGKLRGGGRGEGEPERGRGREVERSRSRGRGREVERSRSRRLTLSSFFISSIPHLTRPPPPTPQIQQHYLEP